MKKLSAFTALTAVIALTVSLFTSLTAAAPRSLASATSAPPEATKVSVSRPQGIQANGFEEEEGRERYIIRFQEPAVASYRGGVEGLVATSPMATHAAKLDVESADSLAYANHLRASQATLLHTFARILGRQIPVIYQYIYVYNGMTVELSAAEAAAIAQLPQVASVIPDQAFAPQTDAGPAWIGADAIWDGSGAGGLSGTLGEGVIVGVLDTGINMDHPSFAAVGGDGYTHTNPYGAGNYLGWCDPNNPHYKPEYVCNDKLIGAWDYADASWVGTADEENDGPEDSVGHGSHTASTVAGNIVTSTLVAPTLSITDTISGVAPHANIIAYDICASLCRISDAIAAAQQALLDGVDVINYSIAGGQDPYNDVDRTFLDLVAAGIFVSTSAGNSGPTPETVGHLGPWVATVAASTHNRNIGNALIDLNGAPNPPADIIGKGFTSGYGPAPLIYAGNVASRLTATPALCGAGGVGSATSPWPPGTFNGEIVVCDRGTYGRVEKGANVLIAGAGGFVLVDNGSGLVGDAHELPAVHISKSEGEALKNWMTASYTQGLTPTGTIQGAQIDYAATNGDIMAGFSARGPSSRHYPVLKPDLTAPGVDIWAAAATDPGNPGSGPEYMFLSGTSMSSPHNAGAAALLKALHPDWTPTEIKSALMTTAYHGATLRKEDGVTPADPFDAGSGRIDLEQAAQAGLLLNETLANYLAANPATGGDPTSLNLPNLYDPTCEGACTWTRSIKSASAISTTWQSSYTGAGRVTITPATLHLDPGATATFTVTWENTAIGQSQPAWYFGTVTWSERDGVAPSAHLPLAVLSKNVIPDIDVSPLKLESTLNTNEQVTHTLSIGNVGEGSLTWVFTDVVATPVSDLWVQVKSGNKGIVSDFFTNSSGGTYTADDFSLAGQAHITLISAQGFQNNADLSASATKLSWYIYPDASGEPAGNPQDTGGTEVWKFSAAVDAPGVDVSNDAITLDLEAAGAPPLNLQPGDYWLVVFPDVDATVYTRWNWSQGVPSGAEALVIDPGDNFGQGGKGWQAISTDLGVSFTDVAFKLAGTIQINCDLPADVSWLSASASGGAVQPGDAEAVTVIFDSTGLSSGVYENSLCIASNDPDEALVAVNASLTVIEEGQALTCNETPVRFEAGIPPEWTLITLQGTGWSTTAGAHCGASNVPSGNFAGTGQAACIDSDATGGREDAYLCAPVTDLRAVAAAELAFKLNYQIFEAPDPNDVFEVLVSTNAAAGPYDPPLFSVNNDFPNSEAYAVLDSGAVVSINMNAYIGQSAVFICFHYSGDNDWYAQLDDVALSCTAENAPSLFLPSIRQAP